MDIRFCSITNESIPDGEFESGRAITVGKKSFYVSAALQRLMARSRLRGWLILLLGLYAVGVTSYLLVREVNRKAPDEQKIAAAVNDKFVANLNTLEEAMHAADRDRSARLTKAVDARLGEASDHRREIHEAVAGVSTAFDKQEEGLGKRLEMADKRQTRMEDEISLLRNWILKIQGTAQDLATRFAEERAKERAQPQPAVPTATPEPGTKPPPTPADGGEEHERKLKMWIARLKDKDHDIVFTATVKLADLGDLRAAKPLADVVRDHKDYYARLGAVTALGTLKAVDGVETLIDALDDKDDLVRMNASENLTAITSQDFPFDADMSRNERSKVKRRWRTWFKENEKVLRERLGQMPDSPPSGGK